MVPDTTPPTTIAAAITPKSQSSRFSPVFIATRAMSTATRQ